ncbi:MAG: hypothetical protein NVS2B16_36380 [Chloroflexota bacterium]
MLNTLSADVAEAVLDSGARFCPHDLPGAQAALGGDVADAEMQRALLAVWSCMAEQRGARGDGRGRARSTPTEAQNLEPVDSSEEHVAWTTACTQLAAALPPDEFVTWIKSLTVLESRNDAVIMGAPNVFVRDIVCTKYRSAVEDALNIALVRRVVLEVFVHNDLVPRTPGKHVF